MKLIRIFVAKHGKTPDGLYSIKYDHKEHSEYALTMQYWSNYSALYSFFRTNITDLESGFWGGIDIEEAVIMTMAEADKFEETLSANCRDNGYELQHIFQPLYNSEYRLISLQKSKGKIRRSWLRLYALRLDNNCFVITGGAIKLTHNMEAPHLQEELRKLERTKTFLQSKNIYIPEDLNSLL